MMKKFLSIAFITALCALIAGCSKKDFLDKKPVMGNLIPVTVNDFQLLLNNYLVINTSPSMIMLASDEYEFLTPAVWKGRDELVRNAYIWNNTVYETSPDWTNGYQAVLYANIVIAGIDAANVTPANKTQQGDVKGQAYFTRAYNFFNLANTFALPYDPQTASATPGIPLPLTVDPITTHKRSSLEVTYQQVISDLTIAINSFSDNFNTKTTQPSKAAAYALLAKVYLTMGNFEKAKLNAEASLALKDDLLDYNTLDANSDTPFDINNPELLYNTTHSNAAINYNWYAIYYGAYGYTFISRIHPDLIKLFDPNDLRLKMFFFVRNNEYFIKALYQKSTLNYAPFSGLATDEMYLVLAECLARKGDVPGTIAILNKLAGKRFPQNQLPVLQAATAQDALKLVLLERRKELVYRGARWFDIRRLNTEGYNITLRREIEGIEYSLPPNDKRFAMPIPLNETGYSGIEQN